MSYALVALIIEPLDLCDLQRDVPWRQCGLEETEYTDEEFNAWSKNEQTVWFKIKVLKAEEARLDYVPGELGALPDKPLQFWAISVPRNNPHFVKKVLPYVIDHPAIWIDLCDEVDGHILSGHELARILRSQVGQGLP